MPLPTTIRVSYARLIQYKAKLLSTAATKGAILVGLADAGAYFATNTVESALQAAGIQLGTHVIADPGAAGAIPVTKSGSVMLTSAGVETRTLAIPTFKGQRLSIVCDTFVGALTLTVAAPVNQLGNNTLTFGAVRDGCVLLAITVGGALKWQIISNDGVALSTV